VTDTLRRTVFSVTIDYEENTGRIQAEYWRNQSGHFDRIGDLPAVSNFCVTTGKPTQLRWHSGQFPNGPHRNGDFPAKIVFNPSTNQPIQTSFMKAGEFHREDDKPAYIANYKSGNLKEQRFWKHGQLHRDTKQGPAVVRFDEKGNIINVEYWSEGKQVYQAKRTTTLDIK